MPRALRATANVPKKILKSPTCLRPKRRKEAPSDRLSTQYMGLALKNPLVASASPLNESMDNLRRMEDSGIAVFVLPSLFEEQLTLESVLIDQDLSRGANEFAEAITYLPNLESYNTGPEGYLGRSRFPLSPA
jgi:hypothetical protein